ncbi:MAG: hypothetical protein COA96_08610 [SAR86 cluster bacterium]|uniref:Uncharacterized protein n=1 Tax=SAR86 cluster bacterium TaxID=2030880 RepID=A0A2A5B001_9GAMM|nr:MAG: hypothetical protein COA96_08610 [SAR86 cluster bacterium]
MKNKSWISLRNTSCLLGCSLIIASVSAAETGYISPLNEFGAPDLQGTWSLATQTNLERAERFNGVLVISAEQALQIEARVQARNEASNQPSDPNREAPTAGRNVGGYNTFWMDPGERLAVVNGEIRTSVLVDPDDGKLPYNEQGRLNFAAAMERRQSYDGPEVRPLGERCMVGFGSSGGPPKLPVLYNNNTQIIQTESYVVLLAEMNHDARIVRIGAAHQDPSLYPWLGDSIGYYEDNTLVVVTTNFHSQQGMRSSLEHRFYASQQMEVTERFTRTAQDTILYQFTVNDPENYSQLWSGELPMTQNAEQVFEYACHEGNYALPGILAGARRAESEDADYAATDSNQ